MLTSANSANAGNYAAPAGGQLPGAEPPLPARAIDLEADTPEPDAWPPSRERLIQLVESTWPEDPVTAVRVLVCESTAGENPETYSLSAANGGPMQLNKLTWEPFFSANFGWDWEALVVDPHLHMRAARIVFDRGGGWTPWRCF